MFKKNKLFMVIVFFLLFLNINVSNAEEKYVFSRDKYKDDDFEIIYTKACTRDDISCSGYCIGAKESNQFSSDLGSHVCGGISGIQKFWIGSGNEADTVKGLGSELFNKYFNSNSNNNNSISNSNNSNNNKEVYYFSQNEFKDSDQFGEFFMNICSNGTSCYGSCNTGVGGDNTTLTIDGNVCGGFGDIGKFRINDGSIENTNRVLQGKQCGNVSCKEFVLDIYCSDSTLDKNSNKYKLCNKIKEAEDDTGQCSYRFKANLKNHNDETEVLVNAYILDNGNDLQFDANTLSDLVSGTDHGDYFNVNGYDGILGAGTIYYYPKGSKLDAFKKDFLNMYRSNNNICPEICYVHDMDDRWYTTLKDKEYDFGVYGSPIYQCTKGGITTSDGLSGNIITINKNTLKNCSDIFGDELLEILRGGITVIKILIPIILIVLGVVDFSQAIFGFKEDEMKKVTSKFIKRVIIAVVIFLVPSILSILLELANAIWGNIDPTLCGLL